MAKTQAEAGQVQGSALVRMGKPLVAEASVVIDAPRRAVWETLLRPDTITRIMPVSTVVAAWREGERFEWAIDLAGKRVSVCGLVHRIAAEQLIEYEFVDPHSTELLQVENVHQVSIELSDADGGTRVVVVQDANLTAAAHAHAEGGWRLALANLKYVVESFGLDARRRS